MGLARAVSGWTEKAILSGRDVGKKILTEKHGRKMRENGQNRAKTKGTLSNRFLKMHPSEKQSFFSLIPRFYSRFLCAIPSYKGQRLKPQGILFYISSTGRMKLGKIENPLFPHFRLQFGPFGGVSFVQQTIVFRYFILSGRGKEGVIVAVSILHY